MPRAGDPCTPLGMSVDDLLARFHRLARAQHGVVAHAQARRIGFRPDQIRHRRRCGAWEPAGFGVVRVPGAPTTWESELIAGWLQVNHGAVVSHRSAARLLGLDGFDGEDAVEFVEQHGGRGRRSTVRMHTTRRLDPVDVCVVRRAVPAAERRALRPFGLVTAYRVTSAARTIVDLAPIVGPDALARAVDSACRLGHCSPAFLRRRLDELRGPGRAGARVVDGVLVDSGGHTPIERRFLSIVRRAGLPRPRAQVVWRSASLFARVDFDFTPYPLVVEVGGKLGHASDADRRRDALRRNELQMLGVTVVEFVSTTVFTDPDTVAATVRRHLVRLGLPVRNGG